MKLVIIGGTGLIGSNLVTKLRAHGHDAVAAAPNTGVNTLTGEGSPARFKAPPSSSTCRTRRRSKTRRSWSSSRPRRETSYAVLDDLHRASVLNCTERGTYSLGR